MDRAYIAAQCSTWRSSVAYAMCPPRVRKAIGDDPLNTGAMLPVFIHAPTGYPPIRFMAASMAIKCATRVAWSSVSDPAW